MECLNAGGVDPCASNPCRRRGTCVTTWSNSSYHCICGEDFTGKHCERGNTLLLL